MYELTLIFFTNIYPKYLVLVSLVIKEGSGV